MTADAMLTGTSAPAQLHLDRNQLLIIGTGAIGVTMLPAWVALLKAWYGQIRIRTVLTPSAQRLVQAGAIEVVTREPVQTSFWDQGSVAHRELAEWADLVLVVPATMNFISKSSLGITDSLALYIALLSSAPVIVVPSAPERILLSNVGRRHLRNLRQSGFHVLPASDGIAISSGQSERGGMANIHQVLAFAASVLDSRAEEGR